MRMWAWIAGVLVISRMMDPVLDSYERQRRANVSGSPWWRSWRWWRS